MAPNFEFLICIHDYQLDIPKSKGAIAVHKITENIDFEFIFSIFYGLHVSKLERHHQIEKKIELS